MNTDDLRNTADVLTRLAMLIDEHYPGLLPECEDFQLVEPVIHVRTGHLDLGVTYTSILSHLFHSALSTIPVTVYSDGSTPHQLTGGREFRHWSSDRITFTLSSPEIPHVP